MKFKKEFAILELPRNRIMPWSNFDSLVDAEQHLNWLYIKKKELKTESRKEEEENFPCGNEKNYYYNKEKDYTYRILEREVSEWKIV